jgi:molybdopterin-guanine dinucleotide biosynthesis protein A
VKSHDPSEIKRSLLPDSPQGSAAPAARAVIPGLDHQRRLAHRIGVPFWKSPAFIIIGAQLLFSISDVIGARAMKTRGFNPAAFFTWWFFTYTLIRQIAVFGQLYIYANMELGRTVALFGAGSIIIGNLMGFLLFKETMTLPVYVGVSLAICAFLALALLPAGAAQSSLAPVNTLIVGGGESRRMGRDKLLLARPDGIRQIDWLASLAKSRGGEVRLSRRDDSPPPVDLPVIADTRPGAGPLGALAAYHARHPGEAALVLGGDLLLLDAETLDHLLARRDPSRLATAFANRIDGRPEPLCTIYEASGISRAAEWLDRGDHHARHFLESLDPRVLELPHPAALDSANTPPQLAECFAKLTRGVVPKLVRVRYPAILREVRGLDEERVETLACTAAGLYEELRFRHRLPLEIEALQVARNGEGCGWDETLSEGDGIDLIPAHSPG